MVEGKPYNTPVGNCYCRLDLDFHQDFERSTLFIRHIQLLPFHVGFNINCKVHSPVIFARANKMSLGNCLV